MSASVRDIQGVSTQLSRDAAKNTFFASLSSSFWELTGCDLDLVELGEGQVQSCFHCVRNRHCRTILAQPAGQAKCRNYLQNLSDKALSIGQPFRATCHKGFQNMALPFDRRKDTDLLLLLGRRKQLTPERQETMARFLEILKPAIRKFLANSPPATHHPTSPLLQRACAFIEGNFTENISLTDVAHECRTSPFHLSHRFSLEMGIPLTTHLNHRRIAEARRMLKACPDLTVTEVCFNSGFQSVSHFNRSFRAATGLSPTKFRQKDGEY